MTSNQPHPLPDWNIRNAKVSNKRHIFDNEQSLPHKIGF
jgi:hypothetical protein